MPGELVESQYEREGLTDTERWSISAVGTGLYEEALSLRSGLYWASATAPEPAVRPIRLVVESRGRTVGFVIRSASSDPPRWVMPALQSIAELTALPPNWDSYGARAINRHIVNASLNLLVSIMRDSTPPPSAVPTAQGGVQLEWHARGIDLEITLNPHQTHPEVFCEDRNEGTHR